MSGRIRSDGFSVVELLVATTVAMLVMLSVLAIYSQANALNGSIRGSVKIQGNVRLAMDRMERDLRMIGFAVPTGAEVGGTALWTPMVFHATQTELGYRADIDGGFAEVICTPQASNTLCPRTKLRLESIRYYQGLNCKRPDGAAGALRLIAVLDRDVWEARSCNSFSTTDNSISVPAVTDVTFTAGTSYATTIEQVYYRYVPNGQPPYGSLLLHVRYDNQPNGAFPPSSGTWVTVAEQLTDFWLEYRNEAGATLTTFPLSAAKRAAVRKIVLFMEGYDQSGPKGQPQLVQTRSEILVRNPG